MHLHFQLLQRGRALSQVSQGFNIVVAQVQTGEAAAQVQILDGCDVVVREVQDSQGRQVQRCIHLFKCVASACQAGKIGP